jgi:hypothetical protein
MRKMIVGISGWIGLALASWSSRVGHGFCRRYQRLDFSDGRSFLIGLASAADGNAGRKLTATTRPDSGY